MAPDTPHDPSPRPGEQPDARSEQPRTGSGSRAADPSPGFAAELRDAVSARAVLLVVGVLLMQLGFVLSYIGAFHTPKPHRIPVAVVAPAQAGGQLVTELNALPGQPFHARTAADARSARQMILTREVSAGLVVDPRGRTDTLLVASAGGPSVSTAAGQVARRIESRRDREIRVVDLRSPGPKDGAGLSSFYLVIGWMIGGYLAAATLSMAGGARAITLNRTFIRLGALVPYAVLSGLGGAIIADPALGALTGHFGALWGIGTLLVFAVAAATVAFQALLGMVGIGLAILLYVVLGNPSAGGPYPGSLLPPFWRDIGPWLPPGAGTTAVRNTVYFAGHRITGSLWVLGVYAAAGLVIAIAVSAMHQKRSRARASTPTAAPPAAEAG